MTRTLSVADNVFKLLATRLFPARSVHLRELQCFSARVKDFGDSSDVPFVSPRLAKTH